MNMLSQCVVSEKGKFQIIRKVIENKATTTTMIIYKSMVLFAFGICNFDHIWNKLY